MNYYTIINPQTNQRFKITSKKGKKLLKKYLQYSGSLSSQQKYRNRMKQLRNEAKKRANEFRIRKRKLDILKNLKNYYNLNLITLVKDKELTLDEAFSMIPDFLK